MSLKSVVHFLIWREYLPLLEYRTSLNFSRYHSKFFHNASCYYIRLVVSSKQMIAKLVTGSGAIRFRDTQDKGANSRNSMLLLYRIVFYSRQPDHEGELDSWVVTLDWYCTTPTAML